MEGEEVITLSVYNNAQHSVLREVTRGNKPLERILPRCPRDVNERDTSLFNTFYNAAQQCRY